MSAAYLIGGPASPFLTPEEHVQVTFNKTSICYIQTLKELLNLESNPLHDKSQAAALKERLDSLYASLEEIANDNPHLSLELPSFESPLNKDSIQTISIEEWQRTRPEEYAIFNRFEEAKKKYLTGVNEVRFLQTVSAAQLRDPGLISRLNEDLERRYRWMQEYAAKNSYIVLDLPPRSHSYSAPGGIKI